jgi:hypothetical protein
MSILQTGRPGRWLSAGFAAVGLVLLAGCGGSADSTSTAGATTTTAGGGGPAAAEEYTSCMAENGVTLERPSGGAPPSGAPQSAPPTAAGGKPPAPEGVDEDTWTAALDACKAFMPSPPSGAAPPSARN